MTQYYFSKFPVISYANNLVRNISERVSILHTQLVDPNNYYPLEIKDATRADSLAQAIYQDPYMDWLLYINNNVLDPYYQWHLNVDEFTAYIQDKYGSLEFAQQQISYYRVAWPIDPTQTISVGAFNNTIPKLWQKYFQPVTDDYGNVINYVQAFLDWRVNTNQLLEWNITMSTPGTSFAVGNVVQIVVASNVVGQAQVVEANSTVIVAQHSSGNTNSPAGLQDMFNPGITATISNTNILSTNISPAESVFWEGLTMYDMEDEINTKRRFVSVIDPGIAMQVSSTITGLLNQ
jgi:hypothetical protein